MYSHGGIHPTHEASVPTPDIIAALMNLANERCVSMCDTWRAHSG